MTGFLNRLAGSVFCMMILLQNEHPRSQGHIPRQISVELTLHRSKSNFSTRQAPSRIIVQQPVPTMSAPALYISLFSFSLES